MVEAAYRTLVGRTGRSEVRFILNIDHSIDIARGHRYACHEQVQRSDTPWVGPICLCRSIRSAAPVGAKRQGDKESRGNKAPAPAKAEVDIPDHGGAPAAVRGAKGDRSAAPGPAANDAAPAI